MVAIFLTETALVSPVLQIFGRIELHFLTNSEHHNPFLNAFVPNHLRVAEVGSSVSDNRVASIFCESFAVVCAVSNALGLMLTSRCVHGDDGIFTKTSGVLLVNHCTTTEDGAQCIGSDSLILHLPVNEVGGSGVSPSHVFPLRTVWVELIIEVPNAILIEHTIRVVHPSPSRSVVVFRTEAFAVGRVESARQLHFLPAREILHGTRLVAVAVESNIQQQVLVELTQIEWHEVIHFIYSQAQIESLHHLVVAHDVNMCVFLFFLNRQKKETLRGIHSHHSM